MATQTDVCWLQAGAPRLRLEEPGCQPRQSLQTPSTPMPVPLATRAAKRFCLVSTGWAQKVRLSEERWNQLATSRRRVRWHAARLLRTSLQPVPPPGMQKPTPPSRPQHREENSQVSNARAGVPRRDEPRRWARTLPVRGLGVDSGSSGGPLPRGRGLEAGLGHSALLEEPSRQGQGRQAPWQALPGKCTSACLCLPPGYSGDQSRLLHPYLSQRGKKAGQWQEGWAEPKMTGRLCAQWPPPSFPAPCGSPRGDRYQSPWAGLDSVSTGMVSCPKNTVNLEALFSPNTHTQGGWEEVPVPGHEQDLGRSWSSQKSTGNPVTLEPGIPH